MPATPFDSPHLSGLFPTGETARLFSDSAEIRAMLIVLGALAKAQGAAGTIPETSAAFIHRASLEVQIDAGALTTATARNGVSLPGLVAAFRAAMEAPEHAQYVHWGATSQDIMDSAQMLRLRQFLTLAKAQLAAITGALGTAASAHAELPMLARTYGQHATPTSFGAVVAGWGAPLADLLEEMPALQDGVLWVSLSGAAGAAQALGPNAAGLRAALAQGLGLRDPGRGWHSDRGPVLRLAGWLARLTAALGKMGEDMILMAASDAPELHAGAAGGSSTMPQKQNPVGPSALVALARHAAGLQATLHGAALHRQQRDGAAWFTEWLTLPQLCLASYSALERARDLAGTLRPDAQAMARGFDRAGDLGHAEALSFALAARMPRPEAQAAVKALCVEAARQGARLGPLALARWPDLDPALFDPAAQLGSAPQEARSFAARAAALSQSP